MAQLLTRYMYRVKRQEGTCTALRIARKRKGADLAAPFSVYLVFDQLIGGCVARLNAMPLATSADQQFLASAVGSEKTVTECTAS